MLSARRKLCLELEMYFACTRILDAFSFAFFIPISIHYFHPSLSQLFSRALTLSALYALFVFFFFKSPLLSPKSAFAQWLLKQMNSFFPPLCTEITIFIQFGIFLNGKQTLKCTLLVHEDVTVAFQSQHGVVFP